MKLLFFIHNKKSIFFVAVFIFAFSSFNANAQVAPCSTAPGGLCEGKGNSAECSLEALPDCTAYPRCLYSGTISGYFCYNNCYNTGQSGSCGTGRICLCLNRNRCDLCTYSGINLNACNDNGCGATDTQNPVVVISSPTDSPTYTTSVSPLRMSGTASDNSTVSRVIWSNNRNDGFMGGSGTASGTTDWSISLVNLEPGQNIITVAAYDGVGNSGTSTITVTYNPPSAQNFPNIAISEGASDYTITITDPDELSEVSYAWGEKPNVYFLLPFANEDDQALSAVERDRFSYLMANFPADWDRLTENKHPLKFYFAPPFKVSDYSKSENDWFSYITKSISQFESDNASILHYPAIYIFLYPEPYFSRTYINMFGTEEKKVLAEIYFSMFNDTAMSEYTGANVNEIISNVLQHEIVHNFSHLPNNEYIPPGDNKYFWLGHPAGFSGVQMSCDEGTSLIDCDPYGAADSPTGTDGYYEAYSIISLARTFILKANFNNRGPELSPLIEMAMGLRSRYEDAPYMYYEGNISGSGDNMQFNLIAPHDYGISSRRLFDYSKDPDIFHSLYWNISLDNTKTTLSNTTRTFTVSKSGQSSRPLFVYASDPLNPGYFKVFSNNAQSENLIEDQIAPSNPTGLSVW